jgi:protocatechuate 3,4-dioxygenase beta subunit
MFKGFGITGKVGVLNNPAVGAKGVTIKLFNDKGAVFANTATDENGVFTFSPIVPGSYRVQASHSSWHFSKFEHSVTVTTGNTKLPENALIVSGFNLEGSIAQPAVKIGLLIYNKKGQSAQKCNEQLPKSGVQQSLSNVYDAQPFCFTNAGKNGEFSFNNLATGAYLILPFVDKNSIEFNITPASIEAVIKTDNVKLSEPFQISGFSASGKVLLSEKKKNGVSGAVIRINGKQVATTDSDGSYTLKNIQEGTYTLQITASDLKFNDENVKVTMTNPKITDIFVSGFKVCGKVVSDKSFRVIIKETNTHATTQAESDPSQGGSFCTFLANGKYSLEVHIEEAERRGGLQFYPIQQTFEVNSASVSDIIFSQLRAKVKGEVKCLPDDDTSCRSIEITLSSIDENGHQTSSQKSKLSNGVYEFDEILPGRYQVSVPTDSLCWESHQQKLIVKSTVESVPKFQQNGYKIGPIISTHDSQVSDLILRKRKQQKLV